ncbi:uncharacterized protein L969DRAFT_95492 [Mixia osmundae IAM 14324]|uniref:Uncharacterized protein n=1 Tax=Mixia osmundae (strain CBS 9802 / IAM 14324 / JCM 22182 / KY 12970) TaxID=764103 RepID=G7E7K0_MIXOS|nr:uncharacterized protein L969DRAFT_95492 [Mixia osmundae IAM 14324]KEI38412.1 hypothetical protein L969DRAFT_95492 [Mixia osmundae IAM 14324]GAA98810.1 hypothetical protein E5Q_05498 [Mixia osmundae IAM 14324]
MSVSCPAGPVWLFPGVSIVESFVSLVGHDLAQAQVTRERQETQTWLAYFASFFVPARAPRERTPIIMLSDKTGIAGRDAQMLLNEARRIQWSESQATFHRSARYAGVLSFVCLAFLLWMWIEDLASLTRLLSTPRDALRLQLCQAGLIIRTCTLLDLLLIMVCLRWVRRASRAVVAIILTSGLLLAANILLAVINLGLTFTWAGMNVDGRDITLRCYWSVDAVWQVGPSGRTCVSSDAASSRSWQIAAGVRLVITLCLGMTWLLSLVRHRVLMQLLRNPSKLDLMTPSAEANKLLLGKSARVVSLQRSVATPLSSDEEQGLPPMPEHHPRQLISDSEPSTWAKTILAGFAWLTGSARRSAGVDTLQSAIEYAPVTDLDDTVHRLGAPVPSRAPQGRERIQDVWPPRGPAYDQPPMDRHIDRETTFSRWFGSWR